MAATDAPENQMSLPERQQRVLDQIERTLQADPGLKSMFAAFGRLASSREAMPAGEAIARSRAHRTVLILLVVLSLLGVVALGVVATGKACPGLSSDQVVASAAVRYAACSKATDAWSKGGR
jgi:hypothetical protein